MRGCVRQVLEMEKLGGSELLQRQLDDMRLRQEELEALNHSKDTVSAARCIWSVCQLVANKSF